MVLNVVAYQGQRYDVLKKDAQSAGTLFIDREFPPNDTSLFFKGSSKTTAITWKRPKDISDDPKLFVKGISGSDLIQGDLGNCWFVAACCCLAVNKHVWRRVIPDYERQEYNSDREQDYAGIFHFRFWRFGEWIDVVIDDYLPTVDGKLMYCHARTKNEFWCALIEKAYAKLYGCYEALDGGELSDALEDFTGGVNEPLELGDYRDSETLKDSLFERMVECLEHKALLAAAIPARNKNEMETETDAGFIIGHAYGLTAAKTVHIKNTGHLFHTFGREKLRMVRLQNPWGGSDWKGAFSDGSEEWEKISRSEREKMGLTFDDDGQFWMTFDDYMKHFTTMAICEVLNTSLFSAGKKWIETAVDGSWSLPNRSGGCLNNRDTFLNNPQYRFDVSSRDEDVILSLAQKTTRSSPDIKNITMGFTIMKVEHNRVYRLHRPQEIVKSSVFKNSRSIFVKEKLARGRYMVVVCTFEPGVTGDFLLRVYSGSPCNFKELTKDVPDPGWFCCASSPKVVTQLKVLKAEGLELPRGKGGAVSAYCTVNCEGDRATGPTNKQQSNPQWNWGAVYYRSKPTKKPITFEVYHAGAMGKKEFLGQHLLNLSDETDDKVIELDLYDRKGKDKTQAAEKRPGKLYIQVTNTLDMNMI